MTLEEQLESVWEKHKLDIHASEDVAIETIKMLIPIGSVVKTHGSKYVVMNYTEDTAIFYNQSHNTNDIYNIREITQSVVDIIGKVSDDWLATMNLLL